VTRTGGTQTYREEFEIRERRKKIRITHKNIAKTDTRKQLK
jgi:hypothetical protein